MDGGADADGWDNSELVREGEFAGWRSWGGSDPFEAQSGPFFYREAPGGGVVCAFRAEAKHMNGGGFMHGGCLLTFADFSLFAIGNRALAGSRAVTVTLNAEFTGSGQVGDLIECRGEVVRDGGLMFVRGLITTGNRTLLNFSGVVKKIRAR